MLDEGYWESLLRDAEEEHDSWQPKGDLDEALGEWNAADAGSEARRWAGAPQEDEADWDSAAVLLDSGEPVTITVTGHNRGGLLASYGTVQGFIPASHLLTAPPSMTPMQRMGALASRTGETLTVRIVEIDRERRRLILSERLARQDDQVDALLASLQPGQLCQGRVTNLCPFGAFVDLGGYEGLDSYFRVIMGTRRRSRRGREARRRCATVGPGSQP